MHQKRPNRKQSGYILLAMLLVMTLAMIAATAAAPGIAFQLKRDREEELVHRGVQYSRAIRRYAKKTGRYPASLDDLLGDGNVRYIRRLYKDPITGKDFRLLHLSDVQSFAATGNVSNTNLSGATPAAQAASASSDDAGRASGQDAEGSQDDRVVDSTPSQPGLLIFGVASRSHAKTIREFNHKNHYHQWLFYYDVRSDQGREIKGPTSSTPLQQAIAQPVAGQPAGANAPVAEGQPQPTEAPPQSPQ